MITMVLPRAQRPHLARVGLCERAGERILDHMADDLADMEYDILRYAMEDFPVVAELRSNRRELQRQIGKMARLSQTAVELATKARLSHGFVTLTYEEKQFMDAWIRQDKPLSERNLDSETAWMLEQLNDPNM